MNTLKIKNIYKEFNASEKGLTEAEAKARLKKFGKNKIENIKKASLLKIFFSQFISPLILLLIGAALISFIIGFLPGQSVDIFDSSLILFIVVVSGVTGFFQDYKAEKSIEALQNMATPKSRVIRNGRKIEILSTEIVPGDLIVMESGDMVPADAVLVESSNLEIDESVLTGESKGVKKNLLDSVFMNSFVYVGTAKAVVSKTGMQAEIGKIAAKLQEMKEEKTLFQLEMAQFSKKIFTATLIIIIALFFVSFLKYDLYQSLLLSISLAVAAIPEGLPAVITLTLALGATVMAKRNALIRKLSVAESIGAVDIICTDKTGTLTKNEMTVVKLFYDGHTFDVSEIDKQKSDILHMLLLCGTLCNNSTIGYDKNKKKYLGDQTEVALRKLADKFGFKENLLSGKYTRIDEKPFTSERKMMSVLYKHGNSSVLYAKGAPEVIIGKCSMVYANGRIKKLDENAKRNILENNRKFSSRTLRVLGFCFKKMSGRKITKEEKMVWIGLQAMMDPPRKEAREALKKCMTAGIRVIMLTGDGPLTAKAVADEIGLNTKEVIEGDKLDKLSDKNLRKKLDSGINIFSRISPFHKLRILEILKAKSRVAMTGDGVNDALALKKSDVGVAMGIRGTEVAKQASKIVLLDDNFASITEAVKQGRRIFDNIRKFINYLFVCNFAEVFVLFLATLFLTLKDPILFPVQILWINLLTDGMPALALGIDPARPDIMRDPPRKKGESIINKQLAWLIGIIGIKKTLILFLTFFLVLPLGVSTARTTLFTGFVLYEFVRIGAIRYQDKLDWLSNKWLISALIISLFLQIIIIYTPLNTFFYTVPLGIYEWAILIGGTVVGYVSAILITKTVVKYV